MNRTTYWVLAYGLCMTAVVGGMFVARSRSLATFGNADAEAAWQDWREDVRDAIPTSGTTQRRIPKSEEPPALVLMRDYFAACTFFAVVMSSALFLTTAIVVKGVMQPTIVHPD